MHLSGHLKKTNAIGIARVKTWQSQGKDLANQMKLCQLMFDQLWPKNKNSFVNKIIICGYLLKVLNAYDWVIPEAKVEEYNCDCPCIPYYYLNDEDYCDGKPVNPIPACR